jgi:hypothetical protein
MSNGYFNAKSHMAGKVYDLTQENMCLMLDEIDRLKKNESENKDNFKTMSLSTPIGSYVQYMNKNGYDKDRELANRHLIEGDIYKVTGMDVFGYTSSVYLQDFDGIGFNTVMFKNLNAREFDLKLWEKDLARFGLKTDEEYESGDR